VAVQNVGQVVVERGKQKKERKLLGVGASLLVRSVPRQVERMHASDV
jgi:hypothetical protein